MRTFDLSPLLRSSIGFDRFNRVFDTATRLDESSLSYPPYNIEKSGENTYRISMAVAGFRDEELSITAQENTLLIAGKAKEDEQQAQNPANFLYRGIARRSFERRFELADTIKVVGASLENGLLHVDLVREIPESAKPRSIKINSTVPAVEGRKAA